jgi:hypothetical protein
MKRLLSTILLSIFLITFPLSPLAQDKPPAWSVYFSPQGGCTEAIIKELDKAETSILVQACIFTSAPIAKSLLSHDKKLADLYTRNWQEHERHSEEYIF